MDNKVTLEITRDTIKLIALVNNAEQVQTFTRGPEDHEYDYDGPFGRDRTDAVPMETVLGRIVRVPRGGGKDLGYAIDQLSFEMCENISDSLMRLPTPPQTPQTAAQTNAEAAWAAREADRNRIVTGGKPRKLTAVEEQQRKYDELAERVRQKRAAGLYGPQVPAMAQKEVQTFQPLTRKKAPARVSGGFEMITRRKG